MALKIKVSSMTSGRGNAVPNQFIIRTEEGVYFQSYHSVIAFVPDTYSGEKTQIDEKYWDYSRTTGIYRNQFLGENKKETERKIANGTYRLVNLN